MREAYKQAKLSEGFLKVWWVLVSSANDLKSLGCHSFAFDAGLSHQGI